jgi:hypothetical protein
LNPEKGSYQKVIRSKQLPLAKYSLACGGHKLIVSKRMGKLLLDFVVQLKDNDQPYPFDHNGPLFHRWLPDGEIDAIVLNTGDPSVELKVSVERRGFVDSSGHVRFDWERKDIDPTVVARQAVLEGGYLVGWLTIEVSNDELESLRTLPMGSAAFEAFGKRVVKLIYPQVSKLIELLRTNYGQYWLKELDKWDSRKRSLGSYCAGLGVRWSHDGGKTWSNFIPNKRVSKSSATISLPRDEDFRCELLTKEDWLGLSDVINSTYQPSLAASLVIRAYQLLDQGHLRQAFIEGVTALEVALDDYVRQKRGTSPTLAGYIEQFQALPLPVKVASVAVISGIVADVDATVAAYKIRNEVVHEGKHPSDTDESKLSALLGTAAALIPGPSFRFPRHHTQNALAPPQ